MTTDREREDDEWPAKPYRIVGPFKIKKSLRMWETYDSQGEHVFTHFTLKEAVAEVHNILGWKK